ncbi:MAG: hypothetical protein RR645_07445, partial [Clostridium sp.]
NIMPDNSYLREIINNSIEFFRCAEMDSLSLWPWGYSRGVALNSFENKYGKTLGVVSGIDLVSGMAIALGGKSVKTGSSTGDSDTNLREKLYSSKKLIRDMDTTIVHINGFDELSHRGDFQGKIEFIKKVQNQFLKPLLTNIIASGNCHITITCDHRTDSFTGKHEGGWVPVIKN